MKLLRNWLVVLVVAVFAITRIFIWTNPPKEFTQIIYVYMPYAHLWASGELPYLNQWYEYPPLTIPIFYAPHLIDMATNNQWFHINYSNAYKGILTLVDAGLFALIWAVLRRLKIKKNTLYVSLLYYSLITLKAHDFIYDSFDLYFTAAIVLGLAAPLLWKKRGTFIGWFSYMAAIAIKYVNAPLGLPMAIAQRHSWKRVITHGMIAVLLVWGLPVAVFRSSLLVTMEYHKQRGIQVESTAATIVRTIDQWTHSEHFAEVSKAYDIQGPVSSRVLPVFKLLFPLSLIFFTFYASYLLWPRRYEDTLVPMMWITLGYVALFMITSPVLSTPYLLWHIPLVAMMPTGSLREKLGLIIPSLIVVTAGMTSIPNVLFGPLLIHVWIGWIKVFGFGFIFWRTLVYFSGLRTLASGKIN